MHLLTCPFPLIASPMPQSQGWAPACPPLHPVPFHHRLKLSNKSPCSWCTSHPSSWGQVSLNPFFFINNPTPHLKSLQPKPFYPHLKGRHHTLSSTLFPQRLTNPPNNTWKIHYTKFPPQSYTHLYIFKSSLTLQNLRYSLLFSLSFIGNIECWRLLASFDIVDGELSYTCPNSLYSIGLVFLLIVRVFILHSQADLRWWGNPSPT